MAKPTPTPTEAQIAEIHNAVTTLPAPLTADDVRDIIRHEIKLSEGREARHAEPAGDGAVVVDGPVDVKPILLRDAHRQQLERLFGGPMLNTADDVISYTHRLCTVRIDDPDGSVVALITIPLDTLERVDSRRPIDTTMTELLQQEISDFLERYINGER